MREEVLENLMLTRQVGQENVVYNLHKELVQIVGIIRMRRASKEVVESRSCPRTRRMKDCFTEI